MTRNVKYISVGTHVPALVICKFIFYLKTTGTINITLIFFRQTHVYESGFSLSGRSRSNGEGKVVPVHGMRAYRRGGGGDPGRFKPGHSHRCGLRPAAHE